MPKEKQGFQKGRPKTGGRKKGTPNKFTTLKDAFIEAFQDLGAARGLIKWVRKNNENQRVFYTLIARMLPTEIKGDLSSGGPLSIRIITAVPRPGQDEVAAAALAMSGKKPEEMTDEELEAEINNLCERKGRDNTSPGSASPGAAGPEAASRKTPATSA